MTDKTMTASTTRKPRAKHTYRDLFMTMCERRITANPGADIAGIVAEVEGMFKKPTDYTAYSTYYWYACLSDGGKTRVLNELREYAQSIAPSMTIGRTTTAPNGATLEQFTDFVLDLETGGRGAKGCFVLVDPQGNDVDGLGIDLLCLDDGVMEFHGGMYDFSADHDYSVMRNAFVVGEFWESVLDAAWSTQDNIDARVEDDGQGA